MRRTRISPGKALSVALQGPCRLQYNTRCINMDEKYNTETKQTAPQTAPAGPNPAPQPPKKVRRVGTVTFGLLLVAAGILLILRALMPSLDLRFVVSLLPVALIALGVEVLIYAARPNVQLKYDGLSIFVCILILFGVGGSSVMLQLWNEYGPSAHVAEMRLGDELQTDATAALRQVPGLADNIYDLSVVLDFNHGVANPATETVQPGDRAELYVTVYQNRYNSAQEFAAMARQVVDTCQAEGLPFNRYRFDTYVHDVPDGAVTYSLDMETAWQLTAGTDALVENVYQSYWYDGNSFSGYEDMANYQQEMIRQDLIEDYQNKFGESPTEEWLEEQMAALSMATAESAAS